MSWPPCCFNTHLCTGCSFLSSVFFPIRLIHLRYHFTWAKSMTALPIALLFLPWNRLGTIWWVQGGRWWCESATAPRAHIPVSSGPRGFESGRVTPRSSEAPRSCNRPAFSFYLLREDPSRTGNQRDAWSSWRAATVSLATNWLCRNAQDRSGSSRMCCLAPRDGPPTGARRTQGAASAGEQYAVERVDSENHNLLWWAVDITS